MITPIIHPKKAALEAPLSPIEQLLADKSNVEAQCSLQEKKLQDDFEYIHQNASSLLFAGLTSLFFSSGQSKNKPESQSLALHHPKQDIEPLSVTDLFQVAKKMLPVVWEIVQPLLINWGIKKAKSLIIGLFTKKKHE